MKGQGQKTVLSSLQMYGVEPQGGEGVTLRSLSTLAVELLGKLQAVHAVP